MCVLEEPAERVKYCVSILFIRLLYKQQRGGGDPLRQGKGRRAMKYGKSARGWTGKLREQKRFNREKKSVNKNGTTHMHLKKKYIYIWNCSERICNLKTKYLTCI